MMQLPNLIAVRGNHEKYLLEGMPHAYPNEENMSPQERKHHQWEHHLLSAESVAFLESLPYQIDITCEDFRVSIMHYCMDCDGHYVNYKANPSEKDLKKMFAAVGSDIILYGHDHCRTICKGDKLYINFGSLGCPAQDKNLARFGIVNTEKGNVEIQPMDVEYDADAAIRSIDATDYPDADNIKKYFYGIW